MNFGKMIDDATKDRWRTELYTICSFCDKEYTFNEFMNAKWKWVDPKERKYGKTTLCECGVDLFMERWNIISKNDNYYISTIHMPVKTAGVEFENWMDYNYWYETMFWQENPGKQREFADFQKRYHTREEAIEGHRFVAENLNKILEKPDAFPQGIISMMGNAMGAVQAEKKTIQSDLKDRLR